jgi:hypothetical protein
MANPADSWEKFLNPKNLKQNLIASSVFLAAYEMLKDALIVRLQSFFSDEWTSKNGWKVSKEYNQKVLSLHRKEMVACAKWFQKSGALKDAG